MQTIEKLQRLGSAASWDSCGGVKQKSLRKAGIPAGYASFVHDCSATSESCRLVKVLQSNECKHDCSYCVNSCGRQKRTELEPGELARSFNAFARAGVVQGLFLSSAVAGNAEKATEKMIESARLLRQDFRFRGYMHLKVLPSTPRWQVSELAGYANRLSLNIEAVDSSRFRGLSSTKDYGNDLLKRLRWIDNEKVRGRLASFTTQLILGAAGETDSEVLETMNRLYHETRLHRTYFSAFQPVAGTRLEKAEAQDPFREYQLYQADWLLRVYGFRLDEVKLGLNDLGNFGNAKDVKFRVAMENRNLFPVDVNCASREELLRVPGIGPKGAERVLNMREQKKFREVRELRKAGVVTRRAEPFIEVLGSRQARLASFL